MNTENIAHEKRYRDWRAQYDATFVPENRSPQQDEQFPLMDGYSVRSKAYIYNGDLHLCGSESELLDKEGKVRYTWRNLDTDGEFCSLFRHRSGKHCLIFRTQLYGYSVLDNIEFVRWECGNLLLQGRDVEDGRWREVRVSAEWLRTEMPQY